MISILFWIFRTEVLNARHRPMNSAEKSDASSYS